MLRSAHFHPQWFAEQALERLGVAARRPQFELGVAVGSNLQQRVVAAVVEIDAGDGLRVAAIEAFSEAQNSREHANRPPPFGGERTVALVIVLRRGAPMIPRHQRDSLDFVGIETTQIAVFD
jgi:hypothetical protein